MSNFDVASMFDSIKESLKNDKRSSGLFKDILKLEPVNTYVVRLIPNIAEPKKTFFHYFHHGWTSLSTGQYVDAICPTTWEERCPICEERFKLYKTKKEEDKKLAGLIRRLEKHYVNVIVVDDPVNKENNGLQKILRFGIRLNEKIQAALDGDDSAEFGPRVFDLTEKGCSFKIKVETNKENNRQFTNYSNSRFMAPGAIDGLTPDKIKTIYDNIYKLEDYIEVKSSDEIEKMMQVHLYGKIDDSSDKKKNVSRAREEVAADEDDLNMEMKKETPKKEEPAVAKEEPKKEETKGEVKQSAEKSKLDAILADLDKI